MARGLIGVLLLAQFAVSAYACPLRLSATAVDMQASMSNSAQSAAVDPASAAPASRMSGCAGMAGTMDPSSPNLCAEHCKYGQQSDQASTLTVPVAVFTALYATALVPVPAPRAAATTASALVAASPPRAILHCVFRT